RIKSIDTLVVERVQDQWPQRLVGHQLCADQAQDLDDPIDVFAVRDGYSRDDISEIPRQVLDARDFAKWDRMNRARLITQLDRANRDCFDDARMVLAEVNNIADGDLIFHQDEQTGDDVLDQGLAAKADGDTDNAGAGEQWGDVDADMGKDDQRSQY